jgi:sensor domain CHASE-containing protein
MSNGVARKSLQEKVSLTLLGVIAVLAMLIYTTLNRVVAPTFDQLELNEARTNLVRAERAIQNDLQNLSAITGDWGPWDDAYDFVRGEYPAFEDSNLNRPTLTNLGLNLLAIYDRTGNQLWGQVIHDQSILAPDSLQILHAGTNTAGLLLDHKDPTGNVDGLIQTALGPMMVSSWPVVRSDSSGPIAGTMIMGQFLDDERAAILQERTEVQLAWELVDSIIDPVEALQPAINAPDDDSMRHEVTESAVISTGVLMDLFGAPILKLNVTTPRNISSLGQSTVNGALLFLGLAAVIVSLVTLFLLRRIIVLPLEGLAGHIMAIRKSGDLTHKLEETRNDEIGALGDEFDKLTGELHEARKLLLDQSFKAGKADNAAEVLHNIRNAMTPLINGIDRLGRNLGTAGKLKVQQALDELADPECPTAREVKLIQYIESAFSHIESTNADAADNLKIASKQARQVEAILSDQEKYAHVAPVIEKLNLDEVIDEAVLVIPKVDDPDFVLSLEDGIERFSVQAHRVGLLQVMGNLILNAYESIERSDTTNRHIGLTAYEETIDDAQMVRLVVSDTGCGFDDSTSNKIFQRGFSSKEGKLSGLGLHWCANAVAAMGGRIQAESDGPGHGAQFHVLLPAAQGGLT